MHTLLSQGIQSKTHITIDVTSAAFPSNPNSLALKIGVGHLKGTCWNSLEIGSTQIVSTWLREHSSLPNHSTALLQCPLHTMYT